MSIELDVSDGVARVTLNRPERMNAIDSASEAALSGIWDAIDGNPEIRCVVLTGAGRAFCAGADMKEDGPEGIAYWVGTGDHGFGGIAMGGRLSVPVIARVNGAALGGGFEMVLGCDLVVAAQSATFGQPEPRVGRLPLDGMVLLPRRIPRAAAMGILLTGPAHQRRAGAGVRPGQRGRAGRGAGCRRRCVGRGRRGLRTAEPEGDSSARCRTPRT